jgi:predicted phosphodiesterase
MARKLKQLLALALLISWLISQPVYAHSGMADLRDGTEEGLPGVESIADLDRLSDLHFAIMSDNKGDSPLSSVEFARMTAWLKEGNPAFVIGLGDHVKHRLENTFIPWLQADPWWREHFYPNVADGENEYYSPTHRQSDYGKGAPILDLVELEAHASVIRPNKSEYYAQIPVGDYTVHLIQMHFSDQPRDAAVAFPESSRAWLMKTLKGIEKGDKDLIVVAAHSRTGAWDMILAPERRHFLLNKADLVLSATTHRFEAWVPEGFEEGDAVCVNTGAVNYPGPMATNGYVEIHLIESVGLVGQYIDLTQTGRRLQRGRFAWIKPKDGPMRYRNLRSPTADETNEPLANLSTPLEAKQIEQGLSQLIKERTGVDFALVGTRQGLDKGPVTQEAAWRVFGKNTNIRIVRIPMAKVLPVLGLLQKTEIASQSKTLRVAAPHPTMTGIITVAGITHEAIEPQALEDKGLRQVDLLIEWLTTR